MQDAIDMMTRYTPLCLSVKDAYYCYGMSKMTVVNESEDSTLKYKRL